MTTTVKTDLGLWAEAVRWVDSLPEEITDLPFDFFHDSEPNDQLIACYTVCSGKYDAVGLLGRAGSGKTFTVKAIQTILKMQGCEVRTVASTGIAAKNANGESTLNRFAGLKSGNATSPLGYRDDCQHPRSSVLKVANDIARNFDSRVKDDLVVIVDEADMASSENLTLMYQILTRALPNRRIRWVLIMDLRQLLPIHKEEDCAWRQYTSLAFEDARFHLAGTPEEEVVRFGSMLGAGPFEPDDQRDWKAITISLLKNRRQGEGSWFANALNALGDGADFSHPDVKPLQERVWLRSKKRGVYTNMVTGAPLPNLDDAIHLFGTNKAVKYHNRKALDVAEENGAETMTYHAFIEPGVWDKSQIISEVSPISAHMTLAVGLKFMVRVNIDSNLTNGTVGVIKKLEPKRILLELPTGEEHWVEWQRLPLPMATNTAGEKVPVGTFCQIPGVLAHAMTPWKAQGLTIREPMVYHQTFNASTHGLMYVVCSRVTEPEFLYIIANDEETLNKSVVCEPHVKQAIIAAERRMADALGTQVQYPECWSPAAMNGESYVWVRDHMILDVPYTANPNADVLEDSALCTIYTRGEMIGMFVKDKDRMASLLMSDDEVFNWVKDHVQCVWFKP